LVKIRTPQEVKAAYENQLRALEASCAGYDAGNTWEAMRLAVAVYVLVNDGGRKNQSLITRMGLNRKLRFLASGPEIDGRNLLVDQPLVALKVQRHSDDRRTCIFVPLLETQSQSHRWVSKDEWWGRDTIYKNGDLTMTRKQLVFALRNKEGGSHFDHLADESYIKYATEPAWKFQPVDGESHEVQGVERATMRQVAWELIFALKSYQESFAA
jgi:hypothetical protein